MKGEAPGSATASRRDFPTTNPTHYTIHCTLTLRSGCFRQRGKRKWIRLRYGRCHSRLLSQPIRRRKGLCFAPPVSTSRHREGWLMQWLQREDLVSERRVGAKKPAALCHRRISLCTGLIRLEANNHICQLRARVTYKHQNSPGEC